MKENTLTEKALQQFAELVIKKIQEVQDDWTKPWFNVKGFGLPSNIDGRTYSGSNLFLLYLLTEMSGYETPVYLTYNQALDAGLQVQKGQKSFPIIYWNFIVKDQDGNKIPYEDYKLLSDNDKENYKVTPFLKPYNVFNVEQTDIKQAKPELWDSIRAKYMVPPLKDTKSMFRLPLVDKLIETQKWICPIYMKESNSAYYKPGDNCFIQVPMKGQFIDGESFYCTLLHEMAHSTGSKEYLNRTKGAIFGDENYAKEELVSELTAATVGKNYGVSTTIKEENVKYLKGWLANLKEEPKFILTILVEVAKASNFIIERSNEMEPLLSNDEKFLSAAIREDYKLLTELYNNGYHPAENIVECIKNRTELCSKIKDIFSGNEIKENNIQEKVEYIDGCRTFKGKYRTLEVNVPEQSIILKVGFKKYDISQDFNNVLKKEGLKLSEIRVNTFGELVKNKTVSIGKININIQKNPSGYTLKKSSIQQRSIRESVNTNEI